MDGLDFLLGCGNELCNSMDTMFQQSDMDAARGSMMRAQSFNEAEVIQAMNINAEAQRRAMESNYFNPWRW